MEHRNSFAVLAVLMVLAFAFAAPASAGMIAFASGDGVGESNNITGSNLVITPHPVWSTTPGGLWVSPWNSGYGGVIVPNSFVTGEPTVKFREDLPLGTFRFIVDIYADDTAYLKLFDAANPAGLLLKSANPLQDNACAAGPIGCERLEGWSSGEIAVDSTGPAWLEIGAYQRAGDTFGVNYSGLAERAAVPEPGTFAIVGGGLVALGFARRRRRAG